MKKRILIFLVMLLCLINVPVVEAKTAATPAVNTAIKFYKAKNYTQCYETLKKVVEKDPSNALAYYYLAMASAQMGKKSEAIENYAKVINLSPDSQLGKYAKKGRTCLETPDKCNESVQEVSPLDSFIQGKYGTGLSPQVRSDYERHKIENLMREMNRGGNVDPAQFKEYKDFSSSAAPTDEEIVAAMHVLQRAGLVDLLNGQANDLSLLTRGSAKQSSIMEMLNGDSNMSPQLIQSLLTNQMSIGF